MLGVCPNNWNNLTISYITFCYAIEPGTKYCVNLLNIKCNKSTIAYPLTDCLILMMLRNDVLVKV